MKKKYKVLLLFPPFFVSPDVRMQGILLEDIFAPLPLGILSIASYLNRIDIDVRVVPMFAFFTKSMRVFNDGNKESYIKFAYSIKSVLDELLRIFPADIVGISTMVAVDEYATKIIVEILRKYYSHIRIIVGGNHATFNAQRLLESAYAPDIVVMGEGEKTFKNLLDADFRLNKKMTGVAYRIHSGKINNGGVAPLLSTKDLSYSLDYDLLWLPKNSHSVSKIDNNSIYGRGCIFKCNFCTSPVMWQGKVRYKNINIFENEIKTLIERDAKHITIWDDIINQSNFHFAALCHSLSKFKGITFTAMIRLGMLTEKELTLLKKSNIRFLDFGLETLDPVVLKHMNKSQKIKLLRDTCCRIMNKGIYVKVNIIMGHPGSNKDSDMRTLEQIKKLCDEGLIYEVYGSIFMPIRGIKAKDGKGFRIVENNIAKWNCRNVICELTDDRGNVVYSREEIQNTYDTYINEIVGTLKYKHHESYRAVTSELLP